MLTLSPYQEEGVRWLAGKRVALLGDEPGLGKTVQAIRACDLIGAQHILIICPAIVRHQWARELRRESMHRRSIAVVEGTKDPIPAADVVIISYDSLVAGKRRQAEALYRSGRRFNVLLLDESHYVARPSAWRTKVLFGRDCSGKGLASLAERVYALSGTPVLKTPADWYPLMRLAGLTKLTYPGWVRRYCYTRVVPGRREPFISPVPRRETCGELQGLISQLMLRRTFEEVEMELPPIVFKHILLYGTEPDSVHWVKEFGANEEVAREKVHEKIRQEAIAVESLCELYNAGADRVTDALSAIAGGTALLRRYTGLAKVPAAAEWLVESAVAFGAKFGRRAVVFAHHRDVVAALRDEIRKRGVPATTIWGGMNEKKKLAHIARFERDKPSVLICNIAAAGVGLDGLQHICRQVIFLEPSWSPAENAQALMRVHRRGQEKKVRCTFLSLEGSYDEVIQDVLMHKLRGLAQQNLSPGALSKAMEASHG